MIKPPDSLATSGVLAQSPSSCCLLTLPWCLSCILADIPGGAILGTTDERLRLGVDCLMSQVPFWLPGQAEVVQQLVTALEHLQVGVLSAAAGC